MAHQQWKLKQNKMKRITSLDNFNINEAVTDNVELSPEEVQLVLSSNVNDLGSSETKRRSAIVKSIESAVNYFGSADGSNLDLKSKIISASADDETKNQLFNIAQTFATSIKKIRAVEIGEIQPVTSQIETILNQK